MSVFMNEMPSEATIKNDVNMGNHNPGSGWRLIWSDDFDGSILDREIWCRQDLPVPFNNEWQKYTSDPDHSCLEKSCLVIKATHDRAEHGPGNYTSARVISNPGGATGQSGMPGKTFRYGKIAARIKLPSGKGIWPAFWLLGENIDETGGSTPWPFSGEIDILETGAVDVGDGHWGHATAGQAIHFANNGHADFRYGSKTLNTGQFSDDFHIFEIEWDKEKIIWKIDGEFAHKEEINKNYLSEFHKPFYAIFNIAVGGDYTEDPDHRTTFPQYMYIDWIRHYEKES